MRLASLTASAFRYFLALLKLAVEDERDHCMRDTDADWRAIGATEPFWGVLTTPQYKRQNLNPEQYTAFYASGLGDIRRITSRLEHLTGKPVRVARALDFGCGTGRLSEAMQAFADHVIGFDISPGMLGEARRLGRGTVVYCDEMPAGKFGWINSFIVFQHIPPERGMAILETLLDRLEPGGLISLQFVIYRDPPPALVGPGFVALIRRGSWRRAWRLLFPSAPPIGSVLMYDYDLTRICAACHRRGIEELMLVHTNHGGAHGVEVFGRRND
jgi:SAM-dependent methyltransferase